MRTLQEILDDLKQTTKKSQPNIKFKETMGLLEELEEVLFSASLEENISEIPPDELTSILTEEDFSVVEAMVSETEQIQSEFTNYLVNSNEDITETPPPKRGRKKSE
jgi:hypothetical protein